MGGTLPSHPRNIAAGIAIICITPSAAMAGDVGCVFRNLPAAVQQQALTAAGDRPINNLDAIGNAVKNIEPNTVLSALGRCGVPQAEAIHLGSQFGYGLPAYVVEYASEEMLTRNRASATGALKQGWLALTEAERQSIKAAFAYNVGGRSSVTREANDSIRKASRSAGWTGKAAAAGDDDFALFAGYFIGRAARENAEGQF
jgi:hypothetical protein